MDKIEELLTRRVEKIYPSKEVFEEVLRSGKRLRVYQGFDPSTPNLHFGHLVGLLKLSEFQKLGHKIIFLIGDFTGMIGDPTGKIEGARPQLTHQEVLKNAKTYKEQAAKILDFSGKNPVRLKYNSKWLSKLGMAKLAQLMRLVTFPQIIKRDLFQQRLKKGQDLYLSELLYPFMQAYDCVHMDVDLEVGGSDQMFNMMVGRQLMKKVKGKEKFVLTTKLLVDSSGNKIGKTEGNAININLPPKEFYARIMNLPDEAILPCFELITNIPLTKVKEIKKALKRGENPLIYKKKLAFELTKMLNGERKAAAAQKHFEKVVQKKEIPQDIPEKKVPYKAGSMVRITELLRKTELVASHSEAKRLVREKAVSLNGKQITDTNCQLPVKDGIIVRVGKRRFLKLKVQSPKSKVTVKS